MHDVVPSTVAIEKLMHLKVAFGPPIDGILPTSDFSLMTCFVSAIMPYCHAKFKSLRGNTLPT